MIEKKSPNALQSPFLASVHINYWGNALLCAYWRGHAWGRGTLNIAIARKNKDKKKEITNKMQGDANKMLQIYTGSIKYQ